MKPIDLSRMTRPDVEKIANAAGADEANRQMRKRGDSCWSEADFEAAINARNKVIESAGYEPGIAHCWGQIIS